MCYDLVDGVLELLVVPDDLRDVLIDVVHVLLLLVVLEVLFRGLFHGVKAAEADPEDDFQSEDAYQ